MASTPQAKQIPDAILEKYEKHQLRVILKTSRHERFCEDDEGSKYAYMAHVVLYGLLVRLVLQYGILKGKDCEFMLRNCFITNCPCALLDSEGRFC